MDSSVRESGEAKAAVVGGHLLNWMSARRRAEEHRAQAWPGPGLATAERATTFDNTAKVDSSP